MINFSFQSLFENLLVNHSMVSMLFKASPREKYIIQKIENKNPICVHRFLYELV